MASRGMTATERAVYMHFRKQGAHHYDALIGAASHRGNLQAEVDTLKRQDAYAYAINETVRETFGDD